MKETKAEKRERITKNNRKMKVQGRSIFTIARIKMEKAVEAHNKLKTKNELSNNKRSNKSNNQK